MPPQLSHLLQPLDVGCFAPLKEAYGRQAENLMRSHINHIDKATFLSCFKATFKDSITEENIKGGFRDTGLVPFDPKIILSLLEVRVPTPTPPTVDNSQRQSETPQNSVEIGSQSTLDSSPASMVEAVEKVAKGKKSKKKSRAAEAGPSSRRCSKCGETGHNTRTCNQTVETVSD